MAKVLRNYLIAFFTAFFTKWLEDFFIVAGIGFGIYTTYQVSILAGHYTVSAVLILFGFVLAKR